MDKRYKVIYEVIDGDSLEPAIDVKEFDYREECVKFIMDNIYYIITVKYRNTEMSIGGLLCWMGDLIQFRC